MLKPAPVHTGPKPTFDWTRPMSWSQLSSFEYDKEQWYKKYILKQKPPVTQAMMFGKTVGEKLEKDPKYLTQIPRQKTMEYEFEALYQFVFNGKKRSIQLTGFADSFGDLIFRMEEYKTGKLSKPWTQKRADQHGQITMYLFMKWLKEKIPPEKFTCWLHWMPTQMDEETGAVSFVEPIEKHIKHFETKRTMKDLREFAQRLESTIAAMVAYSENHL